MIALQPRVRRPAHLVSAAVVVLTCLAGAMRAADPVEGPKAAAIPADLQKTAESVDLICLAAKRPIIVRLHISVDGRSFSEYRASIARRIFDTLDADKNGILEGKELKALPTPQMLAAAGRDPGSLPEATATSARPLASKSRVTPAELAQALFPQATSLLSHISFGLVPPERYAAPGSMEDPAEGRELAALLSAIDADGDERLSVAELARAGALFRLLDINDDEQISRSEFVAPVDFRWMADRSDRGSARLSVPLEQVPRTNRTDLIRRLIQTYGQPATKPQLTQAGELKSEGGKQTTKTLGVPVSTFAISDHASRFDKNGDGLLDERELATWLADSQPWCELTIEMAMSSLEEPRVRVSRTLPTPVDADFSVETPAAGRTLLRLASVPLELRAAETSRRVTRTSRYRALFKRADQNNNNYLEASEIPYLGPGLGSLDFAAMDRDHNGMVFEDEYIAYFRLRDALADGRLALTINVESIDPIAQFDTNHDGRLNRAEFTHVLEAIAKWDRNHDGFVTPEEIPRTLIGTFHMGPQRNTSMRRSRYPRMADSKQAPSEGPVWFQKMDRNHDGEVSLREFLGPLSVFRRLDTNGDGRLDAREAQSAQK
jgi:Ca2+-binding EF-hand superfamily protein